MTVHATDETFQTEVLDSGNLTLVDFWAEWCGPCRAIAPVLDEIAAERSEALAVTKVDVDANPNTATRYGVMSIPTLVLLRGEYELGRLVGAVPKSSIDALIDAHV